MGDEVHGTLREVLEKEGGEFAQTMRDMVEHAAWARAQIEQLRRSSRDDKEARERAEKQAQDAKEHVDIMRAQKLTARSRFEATTLFKIKRAIERQDYQAAVQAIDCRINELDALDMAGAEGAKAVTDKQSEGVPLEGARLMALIAPLMNQRSTASSSSSFFKRARSETTSQPGPPSDVAPASHQTASNAKPRQRQPYGACYVCGQIGHFARDCPDKQQPKSGAHVSGSRYITVGLSFVSLSRES